MTDYYQLHAGRITPSSSNADLKHPTRGRSRTQELHLPVRSAASLGETAAHAAEVGLQQVFREQTAPPLDTALSVLEPTLVMSLCGHLWSAGFPNVARGGGGSHRMRIYADTVFLQTTWPWIHDDDMCHSPADCVLLCVCPPRHTYRLSETPDKEADPRLESQESQHNRCVFAEHVVEAAARPLPHTPTACPRE